jgi:hypothetical protein
MSEAKFSGRGSDSSTRQRSLSIDELGAIREQTEAIARLLHARLATQLETLRPLFTPRRLLGRHVRSGVREDIPGADRAFATLKERYAAACGRPFALPKDLDDEPISLDPILDLHPFEYRHVLAEGDRAITMTNPVRWIVTYRSGYSVAQLESALEVRSSLRPSDAKQFLLGALVLQLLLETFPEIGELLGELRYEVAIETRPHLGDLPLVMLHAPLPAFRPSDALIATATRFSGVPAFIELIDLEALPQLRDPLVERIDAALSRR